MVLLQQAVGAAGAAHRRERLRNQRWAAPQEK